MYYTTRPVCWISSIVGLRGITSGSIISFSISSGWFSDVVSFSPSPQGVCIRMLMVADYVKQGVVEISRAFRRIGDMDGFKKGK